MRPDEATSARNIPTDVLPPVMQGVCTLTEFSTYFAQKIHALCIGFERCEALS